MNYNIKRGFYDTIVSRMNNADSVDRWRLDSGPGVPTGGLVD